MTDSSLIYFFQLRKGLCGGKVALQCYKAWCFKQLNRIEFLCFTHCLLVCNLRKSQGTETKLTSLWKETCTGSLQPIQLCTCHCLLQSPPHDSTAPSFPSLTPACCPAPWCAQSSARAVPALPELLQWLVSKEKRALFSSKWKEESHNIFHLASPLYLALHRSLCVFWDAVSALLKTVPYLKQINIFLPYMY